MSAVGATVEQPLERPAPERTARAGAINPPALLAVARRQLGSFLGNPLGYLFILTFVVVFGCFTYIPGDFFRRNTADFGPVYELMPWFLAVLLPLLAMNAWSSEREHGTEELLLTMPVSLLDAVLGKYLAVVAFFTIALLCNLSNVAMLAWIGDPDAGQIAANFVGWWLTGVAFAALALIGSVQVGNMAIAFVLGLLYCCGAALAAWYFDLLQPFDRGLVSVEAVVLSGVVAAAALAVSLVLLASRRWQHGQGGRIALQLVCLVLGLVVAVNLGRWAGRSQLKADISAQGLSSLSAVAVDLLGTLDVPAEVHVFLTDDSILPERLQPRAAEIIDKARALERHGGGKVRVVLHRPTDAVDAEGRLAVEVYGLQPKTDMKQTVLGNEQVDVFMGAVVTCGDKTQRIGYFDPGLSVEYELVRALRGATRRAIARPPVEVTVVASKDAPPAAEERIAKLLAWAEAQAAREDVTVRVERVDDAAAAAERYRLERRLIARAPAAAEADPDAKEDEGSEGDAAEDAADATAGSDAAEETVPVVLGAVVQGPRFTGRVRWFEDAAQVESDLRDAIRSARRPLPVIGVVESDIDLAGGFDFRSGSRSNGWSVVESLGTLYDVRDLMPDQIDAQGLEDIDVLLVALPSSLKSEHVRKLHDWIWAGRPAVILTDAHPYFASIDQRRALAPSAPKQSGNPMMGGQPEEKAGVAGMRPLFDALGLDLDLGQVTWSRYTPSFELAMLPADFVWVVDDKAGIADDATTRGVETLLFPYPVSFTAKEGAQTKLQPLLHLPAGQMWGRLPFDAYMQLFPFPQPKEVRDEQRMPMPMWDGQQPMLAVRVGGRMPHAFGDGELQKGATSPNEISVVVVGDTDFAHEAFFRLYRDYSAGADSPLPPELANLRNVQFLENVLDVMLGDDEMVALRAQRYRRPTLTMVEAQTAERRKRMVEDITAAQQKAEAKKSELEYELRQKIDAVRSRTDIDARTKEEKVAFALYKAERQLQAKEAEVQEKLEDDIRVARARQRRDVSGFLLWLRASVIALPAAVLSLLVAAVAGAKFARERTDIPASRDRSRSTP